MYFYISVILFLIDTFKFLAAELDVTGQLPDEVDDNYHFALYAHCM